ISLRVRPGVQLHHSAVAPVGNVYVADRGNSRVVKLDARSNTQTDLPFTGLNHPDGVAVDASGTVYVSDSDNDLSLIHISEPT
ncbi:hypothetical protein, partial [Mycobacterium avium]|uniref:hypothetical protein n=1 Tax=Mycobacterium avium TaxID=1764 RepID=UPI001150C8B3